MKYFAGNALMLLENVGTRSVASAPEASDSHTPASMTQLKSDNVRTFLLAQSYSCTPRKTCSRTIYKVALKLDGFSKIVLGVGDLTEMMTVSRAKISVKRKQQSRGTIVTREGCAASESATTLAGLG